MKRSEMEPTITFFGGGFRFAALILHDYMISL